jgi:Zn-dependent M28 family amino/carboxypeptidase
MPGLNSGVILAALAVSAAAADFSGTAALEFTRRAVEFGPRPAGSEANRKLQAYILAELKMTGAQITEDAFTADTPKGQMAMKNIIARFPGKSGRGIAITGHFDTKLFPGRHFVGASDGGSSTGFLLELARVLAHQPRTDDIYVVFFDGEEAIREEWIDPDNLYGSRRLADRWRKDGTLGRLKALINIDMIGDKNLDIKQETQGNAALRKLVWTTAAELGYSAYFQNDQLAEEDDHMPFVKLGAPAIDIIDIDYPPWHKDTDTMDKLSARSFDIVGTVIVEVIHRLER